MPGPIDIGTRRELFVDGYLIDRMRDVRLALHHPERCEVAMEFDQPWEDNVAAPLSVVQDGHRVLLHYRASIPDLDDDHLLVSN